ncbi:hypothetical protein F5Y06DRAFT_240959 [Hypoxylon sp. FL0890]|nr:hypothetical protein F5Y06DRAFT_240959 [Hypoxylon sp. FL0890]
MVSPETYKSIQNWIGRQQEYEATHSKPAPLTEVQRQLLEKLELTLPPENPRPAEPELDDTNWIGILLEYRAARQRVREGVPGGDFIETPGPVIGGEQKWHCQVRIDEHPVLFPGPDGGLFPDGSLPYFSRKKDAKKYAAKCAVQWLRAQGYMSQGSMPQGDNNGRKSPRVQDQQTTSQPSPVNGNGKRKHSSSPDQVETSAPKPEPHGSPLSPKSPVPKGMASPFNSDEVSKIHEVSELCARLEYPGFPKYRLTENSEQRGFYSGYAYLDLLAFNLPAGIGRVENVLGQKPAREKIAEDLYEHLLKLAEERSESAKEHLATLAPVKKERSPTPT